MFISDNVLRECFDYSNITNSNANVDEVSFNGMTGKVADEVSTKYAFSHLLSEKARKNHEENRIYIHDRSAYSTGMHNCIFLPLDEMLNKVIKFRQTNVRPAGGLRSACQLIAVYFQAQSLCQFGGVGASHLDTTLIPYYRLSYYKHYADGLKWLRGKKIQYATREEIMKRIHVGYGTFYNDYEVSEFALEHTQNELHQAIESLLHNLNSLQSRSGNQLPFTSINYGLETCFEGRQIIQAILEETIKGSGDKGLTYIFPCQIFQCDKNINLYPNTPNYDLFNLALVCSSRRLYPNYGNCNWSAENDNEDRNSRFATMGQLSRLM